jgi:hypothetical protein
MGETPYGESPSYPNSTSLCILGAMGTKQKNYARTFGGLVENVYGARGQRRAKASTAPTPFLMTLPFRLPVQTPQPAFMSWVPGRRSYE